ncbi:hypothetical protein MEN41_16335 [Dolichospermum sp. ST_con]|nr:hypothetical protein [Dolichospermum sp. ST_con]MDD1422124.1 hypothetical protein [Dolichospermum sp. ST_sed1]MDD1428250.1 hypothetical protein [Dolichospermum sp. ST_sed9]MDD1434218.1 hypothetical protein [Dolichospermum sp. ST_sed6]MDD1443502.1 hypothetical protein [Dolichospermum sp. ST_sed3]MDD1449105.1 hypothetical protein [Dolichospermum sp. ST_sed8]MDD1457754.1 hypothetical protein [Dolichospermum sp. ST_sed7]MDD1463135.1 hypothetical protein [Dolichospermum sp. ST_sed2]MDD1468762
MTTFASYKATASNWITIFDSPFYPDSLDEAKILYENVLLRFTEVVEPAKNSANLLEIITKEPDPLRIQLLRVFRRYVSPDTSVEMTKKKSKIPDIIKDFGYRFRPIEQVKQNLQSRPIPDETLMAILLEQSTRGQKGYDLTESFFLWFNKVFNKDYLIRGPVRAGRDVMLNEVLDNWQYKTPADMLISRLDGTPLVVGFARYDSDRGGSQEDDRTGGNRDKITEILGYAKTYNLPLKVLMLNDGPGLLLGSMWNDYANLEQYGQGRVMVCTLKMLEERFTQSWLDS